MPSEDLREKRRPSRLLTISAAVALIGGSSYVAMVVGMVRSILVMRLIGPRGRGIQRYTGIIKGYLSNSSIAFRHGLSKELPLAIGAGDDERAGEIEDATYVAVSLVTAVFALGLLTYALVISPHEWEMRVALAVGAGMLLADELVQLYWCVLRSWSNFTPLAIGELVRTFAQLLLMVAGAALAGVTGVMLGWLAAALVILLYLHFVSRIVIHARLDLQQILRLFMVGLPIALISFSDVALRTVDGYILGSLWGEEQLGQYSVAMQMATYLFAIPSAGGFVIWPKVLEAYGADDGGVARKRQVTLATIAAAALMPVVGGMAVIALPPAVALLIPKFAPSVPAAQVLSMAATFLALPIATNAALVAGNREGSVIACKLAGALVGGAGVWYLVTHNASLQAVAWAAGAGFGIAAITSVFVQLREFLPRSRQRLGEVALTLAPLAWCIGALLVAFRLVSGIGLDPSALDGAVLALFTFVVLSSPCLIYGHLRTGLGHRVAGMLRGRFRQE